MKGREGSGENTQSIYMKCPEQANLQRQKVDKGLPGDAGLKGEF